MNGYPPCLWREGSPSLNVLTHSKYLLQVFHVLSHALLLEEGLCRHMMIRCHLCMCFSWNFKQFFTRICAWPVLRDIRPGNLITLGIFVCRQEHQAPFSNQISQQAKKPQYQVHRNSIKGCLADAKKPMDLSNCWSAFRIIPLLTPGHQHSQPEHSTEILLFFLYWL